MSYTPIRFDSRSEPLSILCAQMGAVIEVLRHLAAQNNSVLNQDKKKDKQWAEDVIRMVSGPERV